MEVQHEFDASLQGVMQDFEIGRETLEDWGAIQKLHAMSLPSFSQERLLCENFRKNFDFIRNSAKL